MDFDIGSNHYRNAGPNIEIDGMSQFSFEHNRRYNEVMLHGLLFDLKGLQVGKISENALGTNIQGAFDIQADASIVKLIHRNSEEVLLEVKFLDKNRIQIHKAKLYSGKGRPFEITPTLWRLGDDKHSGENIDCEGKPVLLK
jgi:hypothetical protein